MAATPFTGKLIWALLIGAGLFFMGSIIAHYKNEDGLKWFLAFVAAGLIIIPLGIRHLNRKQAERLRQLADAEAEIERQR